MSDLNKLNLTRVIDGQITREFFLNQNLRDKYERLMKKENKKNQDKYDNGYGLYYEKRIKELLTFMKINEEYIPNIYFSESE